eukprot:3091341-Rhodomonas_salina.1
MLQVNSSSLHELCSSAEESAVRLHTVHRAHRFPERILRTCGGQGRRVDKVSVHPSAQAAAHSAGKAGIAVVLRDSGIAEALDVVEGVEGDALERVLRLPRRQLLMQHPRIRLCIAQQRDQVLCDHRIEPMPLLLEFQQPPHPLLDQLAVQLHALDPGKLCRRRNGIENVYACARAWLHRHLKSARSVPSAAVGVPVTRWRRKLGRSGLRFDSGLKLASITDPPSTVLMCRGG